MAIFRKLIPAAAPILLLFPSYSASAASLTWMNVQDSVDGYDFGRLGTDSRFDIRQAAFAEDSDNIYIAYSANTPINGVPEPRAKAGQVGWGSAFFHSSPNKSLNEASTKGELYAFLFTGSNPGVYKNVTATSVSAEHYGFSSLRTYNDKVRSIGGTPSLGQFSADDDTYFNQDAPILNAIASGTRVGDISLFNELALRNLGLNFGQYGDVGSQIFGYSVNKSLLPTGEFIFSQFLNCGNDGLAFRAEATPEPLTVGGVLLSVLGGGYWKRRQHKQSRKA